MRIHPISCVEINPLDDCTNNLIWLLFIDYKTTTLRIKKKLKKGTRTTFLESVLVMILFWITHFTVGSHWPGVAT